MIPQTSREDIGARVCPVCGSWGTTKKCLVCDSGSRDYPEFHNGPTACDPMQCAVCGMAQQIAVLHWHIRALADALRACLAANDASSTQAKRALSDLALPDALRWPR